MTRRGDWSPVDSTARKPKRVAWSDFANKSEEQLQDELVELARKLGFLVYHTFDARKNEPGFPDLVIVGHGAVLFWELKSQGGRLRKASTTERERYIPGQQEWIDAISAASVVGAEIIRPINQPDAEALLRELYETDSTRR